MKGTKKDLCSVLSEMRVKYEEYGQLVNEDIQKLPESNLGILDFSDIVRIIEQQIKTSGNKFTIAMIGEFKAGKSTTINTILGLTGQEGLSCRFEPDTAKAVRVIKREEAQDYNAELVFDKNSGYSDEKTTWEEARKYTSQVVLNENPSMKKKAGCIDEVRYYIDNDLLDNCNFLDLPGTGFDPAHNKITEAKIQECDAVFWVLSTAEEPNNETIKNLQMIRHKIIPVINIWYDPETGEETGDLSFEEMKRFLEENYKAYLGDNELIRYNARAVEFAMQEGEELCEEWGYAQLMEYLMNLIYAEDRDLELEKKQRIINNVLECNASASALMHGLLERLQGSKNTLCDRTQNNNTLYKKLSKSYVDGKDDLRGIVRDKVEDIINKLNSASDLFIEDKMSSYSIRNILKSFTKKGKEAMAEEMRKEFYENYLEINPPRKQYSWLAGIVESFLDDAKCILENDYVNLGMELSEDMDSQTDGIMLSADFFRSIITNTAISLRKSVGDILPGILAFIGLCLPGYEILAVIVFLLTGGKVYLSKNNRLEERKESTKRRARLSISFQRIELEGQFRKLGNQMNTSVRDEIIKQLNLEKDQIVLLQNNILDLKNRCEEFDGILSEMNKSLQTFL